MSGGFSLNRGLCNAASGGAAFAAGSDGTTITAAGVADTKGAWTQLIASTTADAVAFSVSSNLTLAIAGQYAVDIGIGPGGSEQVIVSNVIVPGGGNTVLNCSTIHIPIAIPAGTRIAARCQSTVASKQMGVSIQLFDGSFVSSEAAGVDSIGFTNTGTTGTAITANARAKGTYVQLTASSARDYMGLFVGVDAAATSAGSGHNVYFDISIGAGGSEQVVIPDWVFSPWSGLLTGSLSPFYAVEIPAGTRIAARAANAQNATMALGITAYGVYQ